MKNKKIITLIGIAILTVSLMVGCGKNTTKTNSTNTNNEQVSYTDLNNYSDDGVIILKNNYTTTDDMRFALKNIGVNISNMKFKTYSGKEVSINDYKGKKIILEISQAECEVCKTATPIVHELLKESDIELIPVFLNSTNETIDTFYNSIDLEKPTTIIVDEEKITKEKFGLSITPTYIFVDETGTISLIKQTFTDEVLFKDDIDLAFGEKKIYEYKKEIE